MKSVHMIDQRIDGLQRSIRLSERLDAVQDVINYLSRIKGDVSVRDIRNDLIDVVILGDKKKGGEN